MIIDDKVIMTFPPPPYLSDHPGSPGVMVFATANLSTTGRPTLSTLPSHLVLDIIHNTFPFEFDSQAPKSLTGLKRHPSYEHKLYKDTQPELQRRTLFWLSTSLRLVSRQMYIACMHVLRSTYLQSYQTNIRRPYTSDPFPFGVPSSSTPSSNVGQPPAYTVNSSYTLTTSADGVSPLHSLQRETPVLDKYIALKVRQDVFADDTELHIEREDAYRDLFDVAQPRARLEDLIRIYGLRDGVVSVPGMRIPQEKGGASSGQRSANSSSPASPSSPSTSAQQLTQKTVSKGGFRAMFSPFRKSAPTTTAVVQVPTPEKKIQPVPFAALSISVSPRKIGLIYKRSRTIVELPRAMTPAQRKSETLEALAKDVVRELRAYLEELA